MIVAKTSLSGVFIFEPQVHGDSRGWFMETYSERVMTEYGFNCCFVQDNHSYTSKKNTLRGMHFQNNPDAQTKLIRVGLGAVLDVVVDLRQGSPTYLRWISVEISNENKRQLFIPRGFAHGFLTLTNNVEFLYKVDSFYSQEQDRSIRYDDPSVGISWGINKPILSEKDRNAPLLKHCDCNFVYEG